MKRRNFLIGGIAASAAVRAWPFRVYSFPSQIITFDFAAEKEKYVRLARIYIDVKAAAYGAVESLLLQDGIRQREIVELLTQGSPPVSL